MTAPEDDLTEEQLAELQDEAPQEPDGIWSESESSEDENTTMLDEAQQIAQAKAAAANLKSQQDGSTEANLEPDDELLAQLNMDAYDDEDAEDNTARIFGSGNPGMTFYRSNVQDPHIRTAGNADDSEAEDFEMQESDFVILAARNEEDISNLEVWVYEPAGPSGGANAYVHHDIMLPAFPLCLAWLDCNPSGAADPANLAAVGLMTPGIELWDLNDVSAVEPVAVLGGEAEAPAADIEPEMARAEKKKAKKKAREKKRKVRHQVKPGSHTDAVLGLAWNPAFRNVLASASADTTVKVWDLATQECSTTLQHHSGKVQAVAWNPDQGSVLLSGSFDKSACLADVRSDGSDVLHWSTTADVEALVWVPHDPTCFMVSSEDGIVACFDARKGANSDALYRLSAHDHATCALSFSSAAPGLLATCSTDKQVKLWDVSTGQPSLITAQDLKVGAAFSAAFCPEAPWLLAAGGAKGTVAVWDITCSAAVMNSKFGRKLSKAAKAAGAVVQPPTPTVEEKS